MQREHRADRGHRRIVRAAREAHLFLSEKEVKPHRYGGEEYAPEHDVRRGQADEFSEEPREAEEHDGKMYLDKIPRPYVHAARPPLFRAAALPHGAQVSVEREAALRHLFREIVYRALELEAHQVNKDREAQKSEKDPYRFHERANR